MNWIQYHDLSRQDHQVQFNLFFGLGWRMISLSVYGMPGDECYAAVWVDRRGPNWDAVHGLDTAAYRSTLANHASAGFRPVLLSVTGPANNPVFAGTFERTLFPAPLLQFDLTRGDRNDPRTIDFWIEEARKNGLYPASLSIYGDPGDRRYATIWEVNPDGICWTMEELESDALNHQARFNAIVPAHGRLAYAAVSPGGDRYASIFRDDQIGEWSAIHDVNSATYQSTVNAMSANGFMPVMVQAGGVGGAARFAVNFARADTREALVWQPPTGPVDIPALDDVIRQGMQRHRIRGAGLALVKSGRLVYARGYTFAEPGYPAVQPTTFFRQASVSKFVTALAVYKLIQNGQLTLDTAAQDVLHLTNPDGSSVPDTFKEVTVRFLLEHRSGLPRDHYGVDPAVAAAFNTPLPVDGRMTDRYLVSISNCYPTYRGYYSNFGYFLLGHVVQAVTGKPTFVEALNTLLFQQLGINRIRQARAKLEDQPADEARYHPTRFAIGPSVVDADRRLRAGSFGGAFNPERDDGGGGLTGAVTDMARLLAMLDIRTNNPVLNPATIADLFRNGGSGGGHGFDTSFIQDANAGIYYGQKGGDIGDSNQNCVRYLTGNLSMVICWNRSDIGEGTPLSDSWWYPEFPDLLARARQQSWGAMDLFPAFGMQSF